MPGAPDDAAGPREPYYRTNLALVHDLGYRQAADLCAPGLLALLRSVRSGGGQVLELGCGSGALTGHLLAAGHDVLATDASPAMLALARERLPGARLRRLTLPHDALPAADAIVGVGHVLNYLPDEAAIWRALREIAAALRPGGVLALDVCDLRWGEARRSPTTTGKAVPDVTATVRDDWAIFTRFSLPRPDRFVREITTFVRMPDGGWRRDDERHDNVLLDTSLIHALLGEHGVEATLGTAFGDEALPAGLMTIVGRRRG